MPTLFLYLIHIVSVLWCACWRSCPWLQSSNIAFTSLPLSSIVVVFSGTTSCCCSHSFCSACSSFREIVCGPYFASMHETANTWEDFPWCKHLVHPWTDIWNSSGTSQRPLQSLSEMVFSLFISHSAVTGFDPKEIKGACVCMCVCVCAF